MTSPVELTSKLIQYPSVTPKNLGILEYIENFLKPLGFHCQRYQYEEVDNLYARLGKKQPHFCFAGHVDVVPVGNERDWKFPPFSGALEQGYVWGRGAADMKGAIACFLVALERFCQNQKIEDMGSISLLLTSDEEGIALNGTKRLLPALAKERERFDHCLVGEPTNPSYMGESIKIGRRGSLNAEIEVLGKAGHVAYPEKAKNPVPALLDILTALTTRKLDKGTEHFQPSNLEITTIDIGNSAHNVIAGNASAKFNIRYNTLHTGKALKNQIETLVKEIIEKHQISYKLTISLPGDPFLTPVSAYSELIQTCVEKETGKRPELSTNGGTSDARFIKEYCPVIECGLISETIHQVNEKAAMTDIETLTNIYEAILQKYFKHFS